MAKISVIVPVYKVEPYLRCCIDSILAQTFRDFELILVDDGSPDNCGAICDEYAAKDDRITVIHQENGGLSAARNTGIDWVFANSDSEWITFVDSDDYIPLEYLEQLYRYADQEEADIVSTFGAYFTKEEEIESISYTVHRTYEMTGRDSCKSLFLADDRIAVPAWGKLFRKELYRDLRFPVGRIHEDEALIPCVLFLAKKVVSLRAWTYGYRQNPTGIMLSKFNVRRFDIVYAEEYCKTFFSQVGDDELVELTNQCLKRRWAECTIRAWEHKIWKDTPREYRLPLWKAFWILFADTMKNGGVRFVFQRIGNMFRRFTKKK